MSVLLYDRIKTMSTMTDSVLVAFSGGKDSIVTLDLCMRYFKRVEVFYMYLVPGRYPLKMSGHDLQKIGRDMSGRDLTIAAGRKG